MDGRVLEALTQESCSGPRAPWLPWLPCGVISEGVWENPLAMVGTLQMGLSLTPRVFWEEMRSQW